MIFDFDTPALDRGNANLKIGLTPENIRQAGFLSFWGAELNFKTAPSLIESAGRSVRDGVFCFTVKDAEFTERILWWLREARGFHVEPEWIVATNGTIFSVATAIRMVTSPGDGVIYFVPGYGRYAQAAERTGRKTVKCLLLENNGGYSIDFEALERLLDDTRNKLLVLCNPNNPTGTIFCPEDLERIASLTSSRGVMVFSDEIFAEISFKGRRVMPYVEAAPAGKSITSFSLGKSFGLTGVNYASLIIPHDELRARFIQQRDADHFGSLDPTLRAALMGAYTPEGAAWLKAMNEYLWENYVFIDDFFKSNLPMIKTVEPQGSYVLWIDFRGMELDEDALVEFLQNKAFLHLERGSEFGGSEGYMRMCFATPRKELKDALSRLLEACVKFFKMENVYGRT
jgi:cystathionine beta-lyase